MGFNLGLKGLISFPHLRLCLPSGLFPLGFPTKTRIGLSSPPYALHASPISFSRFYHPTMPVRITATNTTRSVFYLTTIVCRLSPLLRRKRGRSTSVSQASRQEVTQYSQIYLDPMLLLLPPLLTYFFT